LHFGSKILQTSQVYTPTAPKIMVTDTFPNMSIEVGEENFYRVTIMSPMTRHWAKIQGHY